MSIYGCKNKPRPTAATTYVAQVAWAPTYQVGGPGRDPVLVDVKAAFGTTDCQYTKTHATDKLCAGCIHQHKD